MVRLTFSSFFPAGQCRRALTSARGARFEPAELCQTKKLSEKRAVRLTFTSFHRRRAVQEPSKENCRRSHRPGGPSPIKKVKRKMSNSLNFHLSDSPPAAPTRSHRPGGPSPIKKVKRKMGAKHRLVFSFGFSGGVSTKRTDAQKNYPLCLRIIAVTGTDTRAASRSAPPAAG